MVTYQGNFTWKILWDSRYHLPQAQNLGNADFINAFGVIHNLKEHPGFLVRLLFCVNVEHTQAQTEVDKVFDDFQKTMGQRAFRVPSQVQIQEWSPVDLIVPRNAAGSKFRLRRRLGTFL